MSPSKIAKFQSSKICGLIERGEQAISLPKLLLACETYVIPIEDVIELDYHSSNNIELQKEINSLMENCNHKQLELIKKFIQDITITV